MGCQKTIDNEVHERQNWSKDFKNLKTLTSRHLTDCQMEFSDKIFDCFANKTRFDKHLKALFNYKQSEGPPYFS